MKVTGIIFALLISSNLAFGQNTSDDATDSSVTTYDDLDVDKKSKTTNTIQSSNISKATENDGSNQKEINKTKVAAVASSSYGSYSVARSKNSVKKSKKKKKRAQIR